MIRFHLRRPVSLTFNWILIICPWLHLFSRRVMPWLLVSQHLRSFLPLCMMTVRWLILRVWVVLIVIIFIFLIGVVFTFPTWHTTRLRRWTWTTRWWRWAVVWWWRWWTAWVWWWTRWASARLSSFLPPLWSRFLRFGDRLWLRTVFPATFVFFGRSMTTLYFDGNDIFLRWPFLFSILSRGNFLTIRFFLTRFVFWRNIFFLILLIFVFLCSNLAVKFLIWYFA